MGSTTDTSREGPVELADEAVEDRYRRRVGIILALLAITGAWIAVLATDAATAESTTTREATRLAVQAQSADVLAKGVEAARSEIEAEVDAFDSREVFSDPDALEATLGIEIDPARAAQRRAAAEQLVDQMRAGMPNEFIEARRVLSHQAKIIRSAQLEAEKILQRATQQAEYLLSQHGLMLEAQQRAERMLEEARLYQSRAQNDIDRYGLQRLQVVEEAIRESARLMTGSVDEALASIQDARDRVLPEEDED